MEPQIVHGSKGRAEQAPNVRMTVIDIGLTGAARISEFRPGRFRREGR